MIIGCVKEIKNQEYRVGLTPANTKEYIRHGHRLLIQAGAGNGAGFEDAEYRTAGCEILGSPEEIFAAADMIVKVKEPLPAERGMLREGQILFTYLHLAADEELTRFLLDRGVAGVAYETINRNGALPCLFPMSEIAGRLSVQEGAKYLERLYGGRGVLLGGATGVERGKVTVLGAGTVGFNAARMAIGLGARVSVLDVDSHRLKYADDIFGGRIETFASTEENIEKAAAESDLIIGAVLLPGARTPRLIRREHLALMRKGTVLVDVAVDQGGCMETSRPTTHDDPVFLVDGVVCYCVSNMPGAVPLTATKALTNATLEYGMAIADFGLVEACRRSPALRAGLNTYRGRCACRGVAEAHSLACAHADEILG